MALSKTPTDYPAEERRGSSAVVAQDEDGWRPIEKADKSREWLLYYRWAGDYFQGQGAWSGARDSWIVEGLGPVRVRAFRELHEPPGPAVAAYGGVDERDQLEHERSEHRDYVPVDRSGEA